MTSAVMFLCSPKVALVFLYLKFKSDGHLQNRVPILFNGTRNPRLVLRALVFVNVGWQVGHISKVIFQIIHGVVSLLLQGSVYAMNKVPSAYRSYPRLSLPFEPVFLSEFKVVGEDTRLEFLLHHESHSHTCKTARVST